jgi:hypothetical protein
MVAFIEGPQAARRRLADTARLSVSFVLWLRERYLPREVPDLTCPGFIEE